MTRIVAYRVGNPTSVVRPADTVNHGCATNLWLKHFFTPLFSKEGVGEICGRIKILMLLLQIPPAPPFQRGDKSL